jgi:YHS domain-containing protein
MNGLIWLLLFGVFFYLMMRFGCGAHMTHGHGGHAQHGDGKKDIDPVCGMEVNRDQGYGKVHDGQHYRFCSRKCLDKFEADPSQYSASQIQHEHGGH